MKRIAFVIFCGAALLFCADRISRAVAGSALEAPVTAGNITLAGNVTGVGSANTVVAETKMIYPSAATQVVNAASDTIGAAAVTAGNPGLLIVAVPGGGGTTTMTSTPTISTTGAVDGQMITIASGLSGAGELILQDNTVLAGSKLFLPSSDIAVLSGTPVTLLYSASLGGWTDFSGPAPVLRGTVGTANGGNINIAGNGGFGTVTISGTSSSGKCTFNGASPAVCTATVTASSHCTCTPVGTTAAIAAGSCAVSLGGTTLTITGPNTAGYDVEYHCF